MSYLDLKDTLMQRFQTQWGTTCKVRWPIAEHEEFEPTADDGQTYTYPDIWVRFNLNMGHSRPSSAGPNGLNRHTGIITIQVFGPLDSSDRDLAAVAELARQVFSRAHFNGIRCEVSTVKELGRDPPWYQFNVDTFFKYDEPN